MSTSESLQGTCLLNQTFVTKQELLELTNRIAQEFCLLRKEMKSMPFKYGLKEDDFAVAPKPRAIDDPDSVLTANDRSRDGEMPLSVQQTELMHRQTIALESIAASLNRLRLYELPVKTK